MNLFSCFTEIDPRICGYKGEEITFRDDFGEWQFFWRGPETDSEIVKKILEGHGYIITFVERLK